MFSLTVCVVDSAFYLVRLYSLGLTTIAHLEKHMLTLANAVDFKNKTD